MASAGVAAGRQAKETLPAPSEPPLAEAKPLPLPQPPAPAEKEDESYSFLPLVHKIIKCMDKDDPDILQNLNALKTKFQELREIIGTMPGIHLSPEEQQQQLQSLREQVRIKNELLQKYKSLCMFENPKE